MIIHFKLEHEEEKISNFRIAEAVINLCDEGHGLNAETIAKMILLQVGAKEGLNGNQTNNTG